MELLKVLFIFTFLAVAQCKLLTLSCRQIREFVRGHNSRRLLVAKGKVPGQPAASDMKMMVWDEELQVKASNWAKSLTNLNHNPDKSVGSNRFTTGENLHKYSSYGQPKYEFQLDSALESWFSENVNFTFRALQASDFKKEHKIGHYTQMVWSDSIYLGCAIAQTLKKGSNTFVVVCNYGPAGNILGRKPYKNSDSGRNKLICGTKDCSRPYGPRCKNS